MITLVATAAAPAPKHNRLGSILKPRRELSVESIQAAAAKRVRLAQAAELAAGPRISMSIEFVLSK